MYFNYHAKAKKLIEEGHLVEFKMVDKHNAISPCLLLIFDNCPPMPIREHRWEEYFEIFRAMGKM